MIWCGYVGRHAPHEAWSYGRCNGIHEQFTENQWGEPSGPEMIERGDRVIVRAGSTSGIVIGIVMNRSTGAIIKVTFVMDRPDLFVQSRPTYQLDVLKKVIR